tara:strand:+ start:130 stop:336 length:207 start_codon:yes stop_codon:yes gene_type:complete
MKFLKHLFFLIAVGCLFGGITFFVVSIFKIFDNSDNWDGTLLSMGVCLAISFFIGFYLWKNNFFTRNK